MPSRGTETEFELTTIERLERQGYDYIHGSELEREPHEVVLRDRLKANLASAILNFQMQAWMKLCVYSYVPKVPTPSMEICSSMKTETGAGPNSAPVRHTEVPIGNLAICVGFIVRRISRCGNISHDVLYGIHCENRHPNKTKSRSQLGRLFSSTERTKLERESASVCFTIVPAAP